MNSGKFQKIENVNENFILSELQTVDGLDKRNVRFVFTGAIPGRVKLSGQLTPKCKQTNFKNSENYGNSGKFRILL